MAHFLEVIGEMRSGDVIPELDEALTELLQSVRDTGKKGNLTLTLTVNPAGRGKIETVLLEDEIKTKLPELPKGGTIFFATEENELRREDPRQMQLEMLRTVEDERKALKEAR